MFRMFADIFRPNLKATNTASEVDAELKKYSDSLNEKRKVAIAKMGNKWVLHPDHHVKNQGVPANTLGFK